MAVIFLLAMLVVYIALGYTFWAIAGATDFEGDYLFLALSWTFLGWVLPALAVLRLLL